jgi:S-adenosylmethionine synthetase
MSVAYSRHCRERFGAVLHHNLDKLYLRGGHCQTGLGAELRTLLIRRSVCLEGKALG